MFQRLLNSTPEFKKMLFQGIVILILVLVCVGYWFHSHNLPDVLIGIVGFLLYQLGDKVSKVQPEDEFIKAFNEANKHGTNAD